jgi:hypothetical protein
LPRSGAALSPSAALVSRSLIPNFLASPNRAAPFI